MIFNTSLTAVNESEFEELLEHVDDRFEYETMAEATAIVIGEQEKNWTEFMKGVGLSELVSVSEGQEVIYEGARLDKFFEKAKAYFEMALNKLAEITRSFIAKIDKYFKTNDGFVRKYESKLKGVTVDEFKGYEFKNLDSAPTFKDAKMPNLMNYLNQDEYTKEKAEDAVIPSNTDGDTFAEKAFNYYYGSSEKITMNGLGCNYQIQILKNTKNLKKNAQESYKKASEKVKKLIKKLKQEQKDALKKNVEDKTDIGDGGSLDSNYSTVISYWKTYSNCIIARHGAYMRALGARSSQAKAICTKALVKSYKDTRETKNKKLKARVESYVDTDAFLDAVDFI